MKAIFRNGWGDGWREWIEEMNGGNEWRGWKEGMEWNGIDRGNGGREWNGME